MSQVPQKPSDRQASKIKKVLLRTPIVSALLLSTWPSWREALKEVFVIMLFSLMPVWLGLIIVNILTLPVSSGDFLRKFASSSDLGILAASLLGPLLYMLFKDEGKSERLSTSFPGGLWFVILILVACVVATIIYSFTYISHTGTIHDENGHGFELVRGNTIALCSWVLLAVSTVLVLFASTIRNSIETSSAQLMSADTGVFVDRFRSEQTHAAASDNGMGTESLIAKLQQANDDDASA